MLYLKFEKNLFILGLKMIPVFMAGPFGETCAKVATKFAAEVVAKVVVKVARGTIWGKTWVLP